MNNTKTINKARLFGIFCLFIVFSIYSNAKEGIDRYSLVCRNSPHVTAIDSLSSLSVGNGEFAFTVDPTGLQTFHEYYKNGIPLGTQSQWAWHEFPNPQGFRHEETLEEFDLGHGHKELYSTQPKNAGRSKDASEWYRANPHRLHLGMIGFDFKDKNPNLLTSISQDLRLWEGVIDSRFCYADKPFHVKTACHPELDMIAAVIESDAHEPVCLSFPYPTGKHCDDACDWNSDDRHKTYLINISSNSAVLKHQIDATEYHVIIKWEGKASIRRKSRNAFLLIPSDNKWAFTCHFVQQNITENNISSRDVISRSEEYWKSFWTTGGAVDFSQCSDSRAKELERRVILSQYLLAIQCAGSTPPQETGLTYNSWFGKFHLEMIWWHQAQFALWNRPQMLARTLGWYKKALPVAESIAKRQGFDGVRWMKMTDPSGIEAPSKVGSFLIWQQPHIIYLAELLYRTDTLNTSLLDEYGDMIQRTAEFMYSFATHDTISGRYLLKGIIPAQETLKASETVNPPFELSYWHFAMSLAQKWRERRGLPRVDKWDHLIANISSLAHNSDSLYLAAETAPDTYSDRRFTSDHMAVLGALGILPENRLMNKDYMRKTLAWVWDNWNWDKTWGWDYPMTAMNAARLGEPQKAVDALLMDKRTNTYLPNGHNYQDGRLRAYLPGNGGLLTAIAMMCAGWDGCGTGTPGFPKDGKWNVRWEGLLPMP